MTIYRNMSLYKHNFGSCSFKDFDAGGHVASVIKACGSNPTTCSKDCRYYVDQMDSHRCMKGFERKMYDGMLWNYSNVTALAVWKARAVCTKKTSIESSAIQMPMMPIYMFLVIAAVLRLVVA